jgi:disulfide bond formation protein DsbB
MSKRNILNILDSLAIVGLIVALCVAFVYQFLLHELPCALCVFERMALCLMAFGLILNLNHGNQSKHYFFVIIVAVLNATMSLVQILLHIVPGSGNYGDAVLSLHMYTWGFVISILFIVYSSIFGLLSPNEKSSGRVNNMIRIIIISIIFLSLLNAVNVFVECGPYLCPSDPTKYWLF